MVLLVSGKCSASKCNKCVQNSEILKYICYTSGITLHVKKSKILFYLDLFSSVRMVTRYVPTARLGCIIGALLADMSLEI